MDDTQTVVRLTQDPPGIRPQFPISIPLQISICSDAALKSLTNLTAGKSTDLVSWALGS